MAKNLPHLWRHSQNLKTQNKKYFLIADSKDLPSLLSIWTDIYKYHKITKIACDICKYHKITKSAVAQIAKIPKITKIAMITKIIKNAKIKN